MHNNTNPMRYGNAAQGGVKAPNLQTQLAHWTREAITRVEDKILFQKLVSTEMMPQHFGDKIQARVEYKVLSDENVNDQGINALGIALDKKGNLYGSSRDMFTVAGSMPWVGEDGGYVNRIGIKDSVISGSMVQLGFFMEWTEDAEQLNNDVSFRKKRVMDVIETAAQVQDDLIQFDLINSAGALFYPGNAVADQQLNRDNVVTETTLRKLRNYLEENFIKQDIEIIKGSDRSNTFPLRGGYVLFTTPTMADYLASLPTWKNFHEYAAGLDANSRTAFEMYERGSIYGFRIIAAPNMLYWKGQGSADGTNVENTLGVADVHPILFIGPDAFNAITMHINQSASTASAMLPYRLKTRWAEDTPPNHQDAYGLSNMVSILWKYGCLIKRPHHIALIKSAVPTDY